jgi:HAD superfamily hydrolase (TIGR01484 family)
MIKKPSPLPKNALEFKQIQGICFDIDETLSTSGKLTAEAYQALWNLKKAGFVLVPITGRPAGWCDQIARFWPVDAVIGENGAFSMYQLDGKMKRIETLGAKEKVTLDRKLEDLEKRLRKKFPSLKTASDQFYRDYDLAIDICEDVKPWKDARVEELLEFCKNQGAHAKLSSIHVNIWFGDYNKAMGFDRWLKQFSKEARLSTPLHKIQAWSFIGDSPNDEPMFKHFRWSVGVANLNQYIRRLKNPPLWITKAKSGAGFVEWSNALIRSRQKTN